MSNLRDDWMVNLKRNCKNTSNLCIQALQCTASEEGDPVFSCVFKTELSAAILRLTQGGVNLIVGPT